MRVLTFCFHLILQETQNCLSSQLEKVQLAEEILNRAPGICCSPIQGALYAFPRIQMPERAIRLAQVPHSCTDHTPNTAPLGANISSCREPVITWYNALFVGHLLSHMLICRWKAEPWPESVIGWSREGFNSKHVSCTLLFLHVA